MIRFSELSSVLYLIGLHLLLQCPLPFPITILLCCDNLRTNFDTV